MPRDQEKQGGQARFDKAPPTPTPRENCHKAEGSEEGLSGGGKSKSKDSQVKNDHGLSKAWGVNLPACN